jgi:hypothetical protein
MAPEDLKFKYLFYLFKAPSALNSEISNNAIYGPRCFTRAVRALKDNKLTIIVRFAPRDLFL